MKVQLKKVLALVLIFCLLLSAVPVWAANGEPAQSVEETSVVSQTEQSQTTTQEELATPDTSAEVTVVREEESLRGEFEKHFLMSDGSYQAVVYSYPVHELVNGVWVELPIPEQTARGDVSPGNAQQNIIDNYVWQNHGVQDNNSVRLYIGKRSGNECRAFIRFATMPTIPAGATITAATMTVNIVSGTSTAYNAKASQVTGTWESATVQWSNMPTIGAVLENNISHNNKTKYEFSCLTAVQHWYDGSTTGQNENYGIMLQYADCSIADYNSFYSADCTDATMRPSMTIRYDPLSNVVEIKEGETRTLSVPGYTGTITWTTDDAAIATVSAEGVVTGINAGKTMVTALAGNEVLAEYTAYVSISEGTYYIRSTYGVYMGTSGQIADGTGAYLFAKATSGRAQLNQLWRIDYLGTGYYSIRPLYNMNMGLCSENGVPGDAVITNIGASDKLADVPATNRWSISRTANGLEFYCAGTSYMTLCADQPYTGAKVVTKIGTTNLSGCYWSLEKVTDIPMQVLLMDAQTGTSVLGITKYIGPGQKYTLSDLGLMATVVSVDGANQSISLSVSDSTDVSIDTDSKTITGITVGTEVDILVGYSSSTVCFTTFTVYVNPIAEGEYYLRNWSSDKYIDIEDHQMANGTDVCQWAFHGGATQRWVFTPVGADTYTIHSTNGSTKYYLGVSGDSASNLAPVVLRSGNVSDGMKWKVELAVSGAYKFTALTGVANDRVLALTQGAAGNNAEDGATLRQESYSSNDDYRDEWLVCRVSNEYVWEHQETDMWCWVAATRIAASRTMISPISQAAAVAYVKENVRDLNPSDDLVNRDNPEGGFAWDTAAALQYVSGRTDVHYECWRIYDEGTLQSLLNQSVPVIICRARYENGTRENGHAWVIIGYEVDEEDRTWYHMLDPFFTDYVQKHSYQWISTGNSEVGEYVDHHLWDGIVVYQVGNYDQTIDWLG